MANGEIQQLIAQYGYWLMAFGAIVEGETFLVAGGVAAQQGILHLPGLIALALVGSALHDNSLFWLGRLGGKKILQKKPDFHKKVDKGLKLFDKYGVLLIIALRFAYGFRTMIPTVLGMSQINAKKFFFYDLLGGLIWSSVFIIGGYWFGKAIDVFVKDLSHYSAWGFRAVAIAILMILLALGIYFWRKRFF